MLFSYLEIFNNFSTRALAFSLWNGPCTLGSWSQLAGKILLFVCACLCLTDWNIIITKQQLSWISNLRLLDTKSYALSSLLFWKIKICKFMALFQKTHWISTQHIFYPLILWNHSTQESRGKVGNTKMVINVMITTIINIFLQAYSVICFFTFIHLDMYKLCGHTWETSYIWASANHKSKTIIFIILNYKVISVIHLSERKWLVSHHIFLKKKKTFQMVNKSGLNIKC